MNSINSQNLVEKNPTKELVDENFFNELFLKEYKRLDDQEHTYLDYTGGGLYSVSQIKRHQDFLLNNVLGNPHSTNPTSQVATKQVDASRQAVLDYFKADDYFCVFTPNASGALKIIGESYPFSSNSHFTLLMDNHNSVNGIREFALHKGASFQFVPIDNQTLRVNEQELETQLNAYPNKENKLFAYPAQSNVSGVKHSLDWIKYAGDRGWDVMLDAAAFVPTSRLDLSVVKPCFVSMSFYKIFGYPTGIGCLLIRKDKFNKLLKPWFAGGTVAMVSNLVSKHFLIANHERFEDGTINYLDIPAIKIGLDYIQDIGMDRINERIHSLRSYLCSEIRKLKHDNGQELAHVYGPTNQSEIGGTIIFNVFSNKGKLVPFSTVEQAANGFNISIRSGCFCNPGLDEINHQLAACDITDYYNKTEHPSSENVMQYFDSKRGAVRVSVGIPTRKKDLDYFIECLKVSFLNK